MPKDTENFERIMAGLKDTAAFMAAVPQISTEEDYRAALVEYEGLFDKQPEQGSPKGDRFTQLGIAIANYEEATKAAKRGAL